MSAVNKVQRMEIRRRLICRIALRVIKWRSVLLETSRNGGRAGPRLMNQTTLSLVKCFTVDQDWLPGISTTLLGTGLSPLLGIPFKTNCHLDCFIKLYPWGGKISYILGTVNSWMIRVGTWSVGAKRKGLKWGHPIRPLSPALSLSPEKPRLKSWSYHFICRSPSSCLDMTKRSRQSHDIVQYIYMHI